MYLAFISYKYLLLVIICEISLSFNNTDNLFGWHKNHFSFKLLTFIKSTHSWIKLNIEIFCQNWVRVHLRGNGVKDKKDCKNWFRLNKGHNFSKSISLFSIVSVSISSFIFALFVLGTGALLHNGHASDVPEVIKFH